MTHALKKLERPEPFYRAVQDSIKTYIIENELEAGAPLPPENELARQLGVSRNSVREAAKALESVGILETRHGSGLFVRAFSFDPILENLPYGLSRDLRQLEDLLVVRRVLELGMIGQAIKAMAPQELAALETLVQMMAQKAEEGQTFPEEDRQFHHKLYEATNNAVLLKLLDIFWKAFHKASLEADLRNTKPVQTVHDHEAILAAIKAQDVAGAQRALEQHYQVLEERIKTARLKMQNP